MDEPTAESFKEILEQSSNGKNNQTIPSKSRRKKNDRSASELLQIEKGKYALKEPCTETCRLKCTQKFTEEDRVQIWSTFRNLDKVHQRNFICHNVMKNHKKVHTTPNSQRLFTLTWTLRNIKVCRLFFLSTLGFTNAQTVVTVLKANDKKNMQTKESQQQEETRKSWDNIQEDYRDALIEFIDVSKCSNSTNPIDCHEIPIIAKKTKDAKLSKPQRKKRERDPAKVLQIEKEKYVLKPPCTENCRLRCTQKFTEEERHQIWSTFRDLSKQNQRNFISRNVMKNPKRIHTTPNSHRLYTLTWTLRSIKVCKQFFLNTLGFKNDQTVVTVLRANYKNNITDIHTQDAAPEQRGKSKPWNSFPEEYREAVKLFIEQEKASVSQYNLKNASNEFGDLCNISFKELHKIYLIHCEDQGIRRCGWTYFHSVLKEMNLSTDFSAQD